VFEDSLFASKPVRSWQRRWAALASFVMQSLCVGILLCIPLFFTDALPVRRWIYGPLPAPPAPAAEAPPTTQRSTRAAASEVVGVHLIQPPAIPRGVKKIEDDGAPPAIWSSAGPGVAGSTGTGNDDFMSTLLDQVRPTAPLPKATLPRGPAKISTGVAEGLLISKVIPVYPALARLAGIQGQVVLQAVIGKDGTIQNLHVLRGHPLLVESAMDAVKKWRYRPYLLNSGPVEVETQITVNFSLTGRAIDGQ